ncbi:FAD-dependent monooxygenase [Aureimonas sp. ME7]|uniref:FAD-dependent monooxygenase n=1 Tax=Aureimonas sp. ME7 TaxID=2744252 RepID=UPI0015F38B31|nr:FAD-dependent monooxygenase [Aureimonas sp. ME7]
MPVALVAGAGIAGLTTALALALTGYEVRVFERAEHLDPVGAGLQLSPNALDVLACLGLADTLSQIGLGADHVILRSARGGRQLARVPVAAGDGRGYRVLHRADLQRVLVEAAERDPRITLKLGHAFVSLEPTAIGVRASFDGWPGEEGAILVTADGVRSAVASHLGFAGPVSSGAVALRMMIPASAGPSGPTEIEAWLGPKRHAVRYPVNARGDRNLVLIVPEGDRRLEPFLEWDPALARAIEEGEALGSWPMATVAPRWSSGGSVAFVGDAAHAMLPYAAQGAAMAIEDAWVLAQCLGAQADREGALRRYEALRAPRVERVLRRVAFHRRVYHLAPPLSSARDLALGLRSDASLRRDLSWLYDWRAERLDPPSG